MKHHLSTISLVLLITGAIDSIRNLPATAWFGSQLIFFFILSAIIFLIPVALVSAELSTLWTDEEPGIYGWVKKAFGKTWAFNSIWLQWVNTLVWYPAILIFISSTLAYLIFPAGTNSKMFTITCTIIIFWSQTILALRGLHASARFAGICAILGMILPMGFIILLGFLWPALGHPSAISFAWQDLIPHLKQQESWISLTAIMTSFLGMELAAVHIRQVNEPQKTYPKAMLYSILLILATMILGSLAIAMVLPKHEINLVVGVLQTGTTFLKYHHLEYAMPILVFLIFIGSIGSMVNWILAPVQSLAYCVNDKHLPAWFSQINDKGVPHRILITQAFIVTIFCTFFLLLPNINAMYWFFTALSTELYMFMYVLMFCAALRIKTKYAHIPRAFKIPGQKHGYYLTCFLGLLGCAITIYIGFFPPQEALELPHPEYYKFYFGTGLVLMLIPPYLGLAYRKFFSK